MQDVLCLMRALVWRLLDLSARRLNSGRLMCSLEQRYIALPNRLAALDIGIKSPEAAGAGDDCVQAMMEEKLAKYANVLGELERSGVTYVPLTFSCFGRGHGTTSKIMHEAAVRAARFRGGRDHKQLLRRWVATVTTEVWRCAARMAHSCMPKGTELSEELAGKLPA